MGHRHSQERCKDFDWNCVPKKSQISAEQKKLTIPNLNSKSSKKASKTHPYETERQSLRFFIHNCVFSFKFPQNFYSIIFFLCHNFPADYSLHCSLFLFISTSIFIAIFLLFAFQENFAIRKTISLALNSIFNFQWSRRSSNFLGLTLKDQKLKLRNFQQNSLKNRRKIKKVR
jgi:hypothetical protein